MKRSVTIAVSVVIVALAAYFGSPYLAARSLKEAAVSADADKLEAAVDFPAVRESLKSQMSAAMIKKMNDDPEMKGNPFAGLGMMIMPAIIDKAVDAYITADGIAVLVRGGRPGRAETSSPNDDLDTQYIYEWVSLDRFRVKVRKGAAQDEDLSLVFDRRGITSWKLVKLELPEKFLGSS